MTIEMRVVQRLTDDENETFFGWGNNVFGGDHLNLKWREPDWRLLTYAEGRPTCHVGVSRKVVKVGVRAIHLNFWRLRRLGKLLYRLANRNAESVVVGAVGGMVSPLPDQGRGYAIFTGNYACDFGRTELHADFGLMFCIDRLVPYYKRYWHAYPISSPVYFDQPSGKVRCPINTMAVSLTEKNWPPGIVDIGGLPW